MERKLRASYLALSPYLASKKPGEYRTVLEALQKKGWVISFVQHPRSCTLSISIAFNGKQFILQSDIHASIDSIDCGEVNVQIPINTGVKEGLQSFMQDSTLIPMIGNLDEFQKQTERWPVMRDVRLCFRQGGFPESFSPGSLQQGFLYSCRINLIKELRSTEKVKSCAVDNTLEQEEKLLVYLSWSGMEEIKSYRKEYAMPVSGEEFRSTIKVDVFYNFVSDGKIDKDGIFRGKHRAPVIWREHDDFEERIAK